MHQPNQPTVRQLPPIRRRLRRGARRRRRGSRRTSRGERGLDLHVRLKILVNTPGPFFAGEKPSIVVDQSQSAFAPGAPASSSRARSRCSDPMYP